MDNPNIGNPRDQSFALELRAADFTAAAVADGRDENVGIQGNPQKVSDGNVYRRFRNCPSDDSPRHRAIAPPFCRPGGGFCESL